MGFLRQSNTKVPSQIGGLDGGLSGAGHSMCVSQALSETTIHLRKSLGLSETQSDESANITEIDIGKDFLSVFGDGLGVSNPGWVGSVWKGLMGAIRGLPCQGISPAKESPLPGISPNRQWLLQRGQVAQFL